MASKSGSAFARRFLIFPVLLALVASTAFAGEPQEQEGKRENPVEREQWFQRGRTYQGKVAPQMLERAQQQRETLRRKAFMQAQARTAATSALTLQTSGWTELGPAPLKSVTTTGDDQDYGLVTGRATVVAVDQNDPTGNTVYLGGAYGGVWKSNSAANPDLSKVFWTPIIDDQPTIAVGAIAIKPGNSNIVLIGTGEPNSSSDSYYGLGVLRSTDGGNSWTLITSANNGLRPFHGLAFSKFAFSTENPNIVVATTAAASAGITVGAEIPPNNAANCANSGVTATCRGLYYSYDSGATWSQAVMSDGSSVPDNASASSVVYNAQQHKFYAASRAHGFYVSSDGITFTRMGNDAFGFAQPNASINFTSCPSSPADLTNCPIYRGEIAIVPGRDEMYFWYVNSATTPVNGGIYQTKDGGKTWTPLNVNGMKTTANGGTCTDSSGCDTAQGDYNLAITAIPNGSSATDLYAGAINIFRCQISSANPTCAVNPFVNLTHVYGCSPTGSFSKMHPDQHWFDFLHTNPNLMFFANDGGIYRTMAALNANGIPTSCPSNPPSTPFYPFENLNGTMGSMTQFVWFAQHPTDQYTLLGGTQDNGSPAIDPNNSGPNGLTWRAVQGGDGGYNDINPNNGNEWFAAYTRVQLTRCTNGPACTDSQFSTIVSSAKLGGDSAAFYMPYMLDPQDSSKLIIGTCRVWRTSTAGTSPLVLSQNFATGSLTSSCPSTSSTFVSALAAGGAVGSSGSQVIYAGTDNGKLFFTNSALTSTTNWSNVSNNSGFSNSSGYPISGIALDPHDSAGNTVFVTVMGFGTPHVFLSTNAGTAWTNITGNLPDSPANGVVVDKNTGTIYVATDVGVYSASTLNGSSTIWAEVGPATGPGALPNVAVTRVAIFAPSGQPVRLRVSTYGRGIWEMPLAGSSAPDYTLSIDNPALLTYPGHDVTFNGTLAALNGYSNTVTLSCDATTGGGQGPLPGTCSAIPSSANPATTANFTVSAGNSGVADYGFRIKGADGTGLIRQAAVDLRVIDFSLNVPNPSSIQSVQRGDSGSAQLTVTSLGSFDQTVAFSCNGLPALWTCSSAPVTLTPGGTTQAILTVNTDPSTPPQTVNLTVVATWNGENGVLRTQSQPLAVQLVATDFTLGGPTFTTPTVKVGQPLTSTITMSSVDGGTKNLALSCTGNTSAGVSPSDCAFFSDAAMTHLITSASVGATPVAVYLKVVTSSGFAGSGQVTVQASDGSTTKIAALPFTLIDYALSSVSQPTNGVPGGTVSFNFLLTPSAGYASTIALSCASTSGLTCNFNPASPSLAAGTTTRVTATISIPSSLALGTYTVVLDTNDSAFPSLSHSQTLSSFQVSDQPDFAMTFGSANSATIKAGSTATGTLALSASGPFNSSVNLSVGGCPSNATCTVSPNPANPTSSGTVNATLTIVTRAASTASLEHRQHNYLALWLGLPFGAMGIVLVRRPRATAVLLVLAFAMLIGTTACGGGGGGTSNTTPIPVPGTPAGTYTIVVTGTAGTTVKTANFTLTVQ